MHADEIFVDASTSWGVGFVSKGMASVAVPRRLASGRAKHRLGGDGSNRASHPDARLGRLSQRALALRSDNQGVIGALAAGRSYGTQENAILQWIIRLYEEYDIWLTIYGPSRGKFRQPISSTLSPKIPGT
ncbi:hypothetical protein B0H13DRAFT_1907869 [Mycena leptocephala]|nr:hypothetical protein B0H13DRAFT_1907869 [Mycena leptocephala]